MEMAMRLQMEAESDVRSHSQSQEESDAALAAKLQARFGNTATASSPAPSTAASTPPPVTKKVTVRVTVPPNVGPGQQLVVNVPNHAKYSVTVPAGAVPGSQFLVHITSVTNVTITVALDNKLRHFGLSLARQFPALEAMPAHSQERRAFEQLLFADYQVTANEGCLVDHHSLTVLSSKTATLNIYHYGALFDCYRDHSTGVDNFTVACARKVEARAPAALIHGNGFPADAVPADARRSHN